MGKRRSISRFLYSCMTNTFREEVIAPEQSACFAFLSPFPPIAASLPAMVSGCYMTTVPMKLPIQPSAVETGLCISGPSNVSILARLDNKTKMWCQDLALKRTRAQREERSDFNGWLCTFQMLWLQIGSYAWKF